MSASFIGGGENNLLVGWFGLVWVRFTLVGLVWSDLSVGQLVGAMDTWRYRRLKPPSQLLVTPWTRMVSIPSNFRVILSISC